MRGHPLRVLTLALLLCETGAPSRAQEARRAGSAVTDGGAAEPSATMLRMQPVPALSPGTTARVVLFVRPRAGAELPLMLTPRIEGSAVELARGRMLRADGQATAGGELRFELPLQVREPGTAILRVELATYMCELRCIPVTVRAHTILQVPPPSA